jgi:hypothetical protein
MLSEMLCFRYWVLRKVEYFGIPCAVFIKSGMKGKSKGLSHNLLKSVDPLLCMSPQKDWCYSHDEIFCCVRSVVRIN